MAVLATFRYFHPHLSPGRASVPPARFSLRSLRALAILAHALSWLSAVAIATAASAEPAPPTETEAVFAELEGQLESPDGAAPKGHARSPSASPPAVGTAGARAAKSLNPDISLIADFAAAWFSEEGNLQSGGHDPTATGPNLQALELSLQSPVDPYLRFDAHIALGLFGVEIEEAYGTTLDLPGHLQARLGQFLTRFGRTNTTHVHAWHFVDQPFALGRVFGGEGNRGLGVELSWLTPLPWSVEVVGSATQADGEETARSFFGAVNPGVAGPADLLYVTSLRQFFPFGDDWSVLWGLSGAFGPNSTARANRTAVYGTDLYLHWRPITTGGHMLVSWQTEVLHRRRQVPRDVLLDVSGYSELFVRFAQRWGTAARYEYGTTTFDLGGNATPDPLDPDWTDARQRVAASLTHWPSEFSRFRLQGSSDLPGWRANPIWSVFLTAQFAIGAHAAHKF